VSADSVIKKVISKQECLFTSEIPNGNNIHKLNFKSPYFVGIKLQGTNNVWFERLG